MARSIRFGSKRGFGASQLGSPRAGGPPLFRVLLLIAALGAAAPSRAEPGAGGGKYGLGVFVGEPIGITGWFDVGGKNSVDLKLSYSLDNYLYGAGDYRWSFPQFLGGKSEPFTKDLLGYVGVGAAFLAKSSSAGHATSSRAGFAGRVPLGVEWRDPASPPLGVFIEFAPGFLIVPDTDLLLTAGIGIRYYF